MPPNCLGQTACFSSPLGCVGAKLLMLGALLLAVLPFLRLLLGPGRDPIESPAKFGLYLTYVALTTALFVAAAAVLGEAAEHVLDSVDEHWAQIDLALPDDAFLCSGHRRNLFRSSAETSLSVLTTLASAAIVLLLSLIALTLYTRYATVGALLGASARDGAAGRAAEYAEGGTAAGALRGSHSLGNPSADASGAWWFSTSPVKRPPTHEPLIAEEGPDAHTSLAAAGRAGSAPLVPNGSPAGSGRYDGAGTADRYDAVDRYNYDGMRRGGSEGANHFVYGREQRHTYGDEQRHTARTSMLSNIDNDGLGQALMNNAALFPQWVSTSVPRLSCSMRLVLAVLATALAYVAGMVYFDAVGASAVPFEGAARQSRRMTLPFFLDYSLDYSSADIIPSISPYPLNFNLDGTLLSITNGFSHGTTTILLSNSKVAEIEVYLDVTSAHELADEVVLTNSSCTDSSNATWAEQVACYEPSYFQPGTGCASTKIFGCKSAQLNISAQPPASCDERCGWYWLWFPCRCHTSANLTIVLPTAAINANISAILNAPYSTALVISTPFLFQVKSLPLDPFIPPPVPVMARTTLLFVHVNDSLLRSPPPPARLHQPSRRRAQRRPRAHRPLRRRRRRRPRPLRRLLAARQVCRQQPAHPSAGRRAPRAGAHDGRAQRELRRRRRHPRRHLCGLRRRRARRLPFSHRRLRRTAVLLRRPQRVRLRRSRAAAALLPRPPLPRPPCPAGALVSAPRRALGRRYLWVGGDACKDAAEPVGPPRPNVSDTEVAPPFGLMLGPLRLSASGAFPGAVLMNGTVISASAPMTARSGIMAYQGARFVGSMAMSFTDDEGRGSAANLNNVAVLDCSVCKPTADIGYLTWDDLPLSQDLPTIFCACPEPVIAGARRSSSPAQFPSTLQLKGFAFLIAGMQATRGILFESHDADLTALLAIASNLTAASTSGARHRLPPTAIVCHRLPPSATACHRLPPTAIEGRGWPRIAAKRRQSPLMAASLAPHRFLRYTHARRVRTDER